MRARWRQWLTSLSKKARTLRQRGWQLLHSIKDLLLFLLYALRAVLTPPSRFGRRLALATLHYLIWFVWIPILILATPWRWYYNLILRAPLNYWVWRPLKRLFWGLWHALGRLGIQLRAALTALGHGLRRTLYLIPTTLFAPLRRYWANAQPARLAWWRARRSQWWLFYARLRLRLHLRRPQPPANAIVAPTVILPTPQNQPTRRQNLLTIASTLAALFFVVILSLRLNNNSPTSTEPVVITATPGPTRAVIEITPTLPWPTPDPLSGGGTLAFTQLIDGQTDIFALAVGQANPIRLTNNPDIDRDPVWSPDGRQLAFTSRRAQNWDIYLLDLPSGQLRRITTQPGYDAAPSWSPDGQWLVYESFQGDNLDIYIIRIDGQTDPIRVTEDASLDHSPVWGPSGRHIAFTSWRDGNPDIFLMSLDAASDATAANLTLTPDKFEDQPTFHPLGTHLAYDENSDGLELIYILPLKEDYTAAAPPQTIGQGQHPAWSPDGAELMYAHTSGQQNFLLATAIDAFSIAPQAFVSAGTLADPIWTAVTLPSTLPPELETIAAHNPPPLYTEFINPPQPTGPPYLLWPTDVNAPSPYLNDHVDQSFLALRDRVLQETGWDFLGQLEHMYEPLELAPLPGLPAQNWNKAGRAFDIFYRYALTFQPDVEVVREDRGNETYWRLYLRATTQDGSLGEPVRARSWDFRARYGSDPQYYDQGGKAKDNVLNGYYVDFTALAADYGWYPVPSTPNWRTYFPGILYWHYEKRENLSWEEAMRQLYTADELNQQFGINP
ncbi:MAG TPA: hypothetical protein VLL52_10940 [Anaerolineae bacterium]|nr:hypothetical protein [Anaerolineae bacterium]